MFSLFQDFLSISKEPVSNLDAKLSPHIFNSNNRLFMFAYICSDLYILQIFTVPLLDWICSLRITLLVSNFAKNSSFSTFVLKQRFIYFRVTIITDIRKFTSYVQAFGMVPCRFQTDRLQRNCSLPGRISRSRLHVVIFEQLKNLL